MTARQSERAREAELHALRNQIEREQTVHDTRIARKFYQILDSTNRPKHWTTLIRYPRINGKRK